MSTPPSIARNLTPLISALGAVSLVAALVQLVLLVPLLGAARIENLLALALLAVAVGAKRLRGFPLGFAAAFMALLYGGAGAGIVAASLNSFGSYLHHPLRKRMSMVLRTAVEATVAGVVILVLRGDRWNQAPGAMDLRGIGAALAGTLALYAIHVVSELFFRLQDPTRSLQTRLLRPLGSYLSGAFASSLVLLILRSDAPLRLLLFLAPVAYLTYLTYEIHQSRTREEREHSEKLQNSETQLADLYLSTIKSLALAIDAKDQYTHQHILRVQRYSVAVGAKMGLSGNEMEGLSTGALLHDIGKLGVPEYVLLKPGRLTPDEFEKIKKHPEIGAAILDPVEFPWPVLPVVKYHHEKWNGTGYPEGLKGENIPLTARILAVADVYDALTSTRSYRNAWPHERALKLIKEEAGTHFDPVVAEAFLAVINHVVEEMAQEGTGPLAPHGENKVFISKADEAARDIHKASSELWALYEVAQTLSASIGTSETLDILARKLEAILPGTACLFLMRRENTPDILEVRAAVGINRDLLINAYTAGPRSLTLQTVKSRETYLGEYDHDDLLVGGSSTNPWLPLNSAIIVPIVHQGEALGSINLYHQQAGAFRPHDQQLLEMIAERAALALYNGMLYDRTRSDAFTDPLTQLYNLRFFTQYLEKQCRERTPSQAFALLCLDLDNFKPVNDIFGHQRGDQVLKDLAEVLKIGVGPRDIIARYSGDEFLIFLDGADPAKARAIADRLVRLIDAYDPGLNHVRLGALRLGASVGFSCFPPDGTDCNTLISTADLHMYRDKTDRKLGTLVKVEEKPAVKRTPTRKAA